MFFLAKKLQIQAIVRILRNTAFIMLELLIPTSVNWRFKKKNSTPSWPLKLSLSNTLNPNVLQSSCSGLYRAGSRICCCVRVKQDVHEKMHAYSISVPWGRTVRCSDVLPQSPSAWRGSWGPLKWRLMVSKPKHNYTSILKTVLHITRHGVLSLPLPCLNQTLSWLVQHTLTSLQSFCLYQ